MTPLSLTLEGFRSFRGSQTIDFTDLGLFAIVGDTGAGKSSILEAMVYALYNKSTWNQTSIKPLIALDADTMRVLLRFRVGDRTYEVTRSASRVSGRVSLHALRSPDDSTYRVDTESSVNAEILRITGLSYRTFVTTVVLPQGQFADLLMASDGVRTSILSELLGLDEIDRIRETIEAPFEQTRAAALKWRTRLETFGPNPEQELQRLRSRHEEAVRASAKFDERRTRVDETVRSIVACDVRLAAFAEEQKTLGVIANGAAEILRLREIEGEARHDVEFARRAVDEKKSSYEEALDDERALADDGRDEPRVAAALVTLDGLIRDRGALVGKQNQRDDDAVAIALREKNAAAAVIEAERAEVASAEARRVRDEAVRAAQLRHEAEATGRDAWRAFVDAHSAESRCAAAVSQARAGLDDARTKREEAAEQQARASDVYEAAAARLESERHANVVADAARGLASGDACSICGTTLREDFVAPIAAGLETAERTRSQAEKDRRSASRQEAALSERLATAEGAYASACTDAERSTQSLAVASIRLVEAGVRVGAESENDALESLRDAMKSAELEAERTSATFVTLEAARAGLLARRNAETERLVGDRARQKALVAEVDRIERALRVGAESIPESLRPADTYESALMAAKGVANEAAQEARAARERARRESAALDSVRDRLVLTEARYMRDLDTPMRASAAKAEAAISNLADASLRAAAPTKTSDLVDHALAWAESLATWSQSELARSLAAAAVASGERQTLETRVAAILAESGLVEVRELAEAAQRHVAESAVLRRDVELAERAAEFAVQARQRLSKLEPLESALGRLRRYLQNNEFKEFLMRRRERTLLGCATEVLRAMTNGTYAFAEGFAILDGFRQQTRDARTLSGGEKFLASLALALGLVEIASLAGGRLDALFLDEGFGSLDATALDAALAELSERAAGGKMIGIITHVGAVADAIDTVLRVRRLPAGSAVTRLVGVERDDFLSGGGSGLLEAAG